MTPDVAELGARNDDGTGVEAPVADCPDESFDLFGDPDALDDAFFDALARLLLDVNQSDEPQQDAEEEAA